MSGGIGGVSAGLPELFMMGMFVLFGIVPLLAGAWALYTLYKIRGTLDRIEQLLRSRG
jgi:hypothetical protein